MYTPKLSDRHVMAFSVDADQTERVRVYTVFHSNFSVITAILGWLPQTFRVSEFLGFLWYHRRRRAVDVLSLYVVWLWNTDIDLDSSSVLQTKHWFWPLAHIFGTVLASSNKTIETLNYFSILCLSLLIEHHVIINSFKHFIFKFWCQFYTF